MAAYFNPLPPDILDSSLQSTPLTTNTRNAITSGLWGHRLQVLMRIPKVSDLDSYFRYYIEQSDLFDPGRSTWATTHRNIIEISTLLQQDLKRDELKHQLKSRYHLEQLFDEDNSLDRSINLTIRLLLMVKVGNLTDYFSAYKPLAWEEGVCLREFVRVTFMPRGILDNERVKLDKLFVAKNIVRIAGIRIVWTDNLADHLRILDEGTQVAIFHHASFLEVARYSELFPAGLIDETLRTLALLFPSNDETRIWFKKLSWRTKLDTRLIQCGQLRAEHRQIDEFDFWRDRLVILKQLFDENEPMTWFQWWRDRRRGLQRYPFLLAALALALTLLVGLIQCVEGAIQVYKAFHPS